MEINNIEELRIKREELNDEMFRLQTGFSGEEEERYYSEVNEELDPQEEYDDYKASLLEQIHLELNEINDQIFKHELNNEIKTNRKTAMKEFREFESGILISDSGPKTDKLSRLDLANVLASHICKKGTTTPLNIGVFGE